MVVRNRGIRPSYLLGIGLTVLGFGAYQVATQKGYFSDTQRIGQPDLAGLSTTSDGAPPPWGQTAQVTEPFTASQSDSPVLPPPGNLISYVGSNAVGSSTPIYSGTNSGFIPPNSVASQGDIQVYFSPKGGCPEAIVAQLNMAQRQILIQAYSFTSEPIAAASVAAHQRGVQVCAVLDKSQESEQYSAADFLANSGIPTLIDAQHAIAHNKVILIDGMTLITGSFNFTTNAEQSNAENMLIIHNRPDLYSEYEKNFQHHFEHSKKYVGRGTTGKPAVHSTHRQSSR